MKPGAFVWRIQTQVDTGTKGFTREGTDWPPVDRSAIALIDFVDDLVRLPCVLSVSAARQYGSNALQIMPRGLGPHRQALC